MQRIKVYRLRSTRTAEHFSGSRNQLLLPFANLVRVNLELRTQLGHRFVLTQRG